MTSSPALGQMSTGRLYAALLTKLENDKAELERERDFLKKELAVQKFRNCKLEKAMEELKRAEQEKALVGMSSESEYSESDTADTELERTPAPSPEMRAVTISSQPVPVLPLCTVIAEDSIPERRANLSHETGGVVPQVQPLRKDHEGSNNNGDTISNCNLFWRDWGNSEGYIFSRRGKLVELPGGIQTTFGQLHEGSRFWLIKKDVYPEQGYDVEDPEYIMLNYECRIKCQCGFRGTADMDAIIKRLTIVGDEMHLAEVDRPAAADLGGST